MRGQEVADGYGIARIKGHDGQGRAGSDHGVARQGVANAVDAPGPHRIPEFDISAGIILNNHVFMIGVVGGTGAEGGRVIHDLTDDRLERGQLV